MSRLIFSDVHGNKALWNQIKRLIKPGDEVYFLGDAADRGDDGWEIIKEILRHPQITYIKGNHEDMLVKAMIEYKKNDGIPGEDWDLLVRNGGYSTFRDWEQEGAETGWTVALRQLPHHAPLTLADGRICHLCHAGFSSDRFNFESPDASRALIWDRKHIEDDVEDQSCIVVHGHTPVQHLSDNCLDDPAPLAYDNKINIDMGTFLSGVVCLLDIDKMEPHIITAEGERK